MDKGEDTAVSGQNFGGGNLWVTLAMTAAITVAITLAMMVMSVATGGFASDGPGPVPAPRGWSLPIIIHLMTALPALVIGAAILWRRKGTAGHKLWGRIYAVLMLITATASLFIGAPGSGIGGTGFSFIHIFTAMTYCSIPYAVWSARKGRIAAHRSAMQGLYVGLCIAGLFTLIPGRLLGNLIF